MNIIQENPYRLLDVYSNSPTKERIANCNRQKAFLKVGKSMTFQFNLYGILSPIKRTVETITDAEAKLALPNEQLKYSQFWFMKITPFDDVAFNHLFAGNIAAAISIWEKKENVSSLQNRIVCMLIKKDYATAIHYAQKLYSFYIPDFVNIVLGEHSTVSIDNIAYDFLDTLCAELDVKQILPYISKDSWKEYISAKSVTPLIESLQLAIDKSKASKGKDSKTRLTAGIELMNETKDILPQLQIFLTTENLQYQIIADKLGIEILQCGIDYFNDSDELDAAYKVIKLQQYAQSIVVGKMAKDRCKENTDILNEIIKNLPPLEVFVEDRAIKEELKKYCQLPNKISYAVSLLNNTRPHLQNIKAKLGSNNAYYLKLSTQVVGNALHNIIEEVNEVQKYETIEIYGQQVKFETVFSHKTKINKIESTLKSAWEATKLIDTFDLELNFKNNIYDKNRSILEKMHEQIKMIVEEPPTPIIKDPPIIDPPKSEFLFMESVSCTRLLLWLIFIIAGFLIYLSFQA